MNMGYDIYPTLDSNSQLVSSQASADFSLGHSIGQTFADEVFKFFWGHFRGDLLSSPVQVSFLNHAHNTS